MINYAYYEVFGTFFKLSPGRIGQVNEPMVKLLSDYYFLVPVSIYILGTIVFLFLIISSAVFISKRKKFGKKIEKFISDINFLKPKRQSIYISPLIYLLIFLLVNTSIYFFLYNYKKSIKSENFTQSKYFSDLGIYGFLFEEMVGGIKNKIDKIYLGDNPVVDYENDIDIIKTSQENLALLNNNPKSQSMVLKEKLDKPNILIYQIETMGSWALKQSPSPMPFLEKLIEENISVNHFFSNSCITVNAEFSSVCSFYPESKGPISDIFSKNDYYCLPSILKEKYGYETSLFHANESNFWNRNNLGPRWGYENMYFTPYYKNREYDGVVLSDAIKKMKASDKPSFNFVIGFTSHSPHNQHFVDVYKKEFNIDITPYDQPLNKDLKFTENEDTIRLYFGFLKQVDDAIKNMFQELENNNLLDNTIVIIYGDHRYYNFKYDDKVKTFFDYNEIPFVMYVPGDYKGKIKEIASQIDIAPTLLNIIEGKNYSLPPTFLGQSLFSDKHPDSIINVCNGDAFYYDKNTIIFNYILQNTNYNLVNFNKFAEYKYKDYLKNLANIISASDRIIEYNKMKLAAFGRQSKETKILDANVGTDTDKDGLSDMREKIYGTDKNNPDSDGDGFLDGEEVVHGYDPLGPGKKNSY